MTPQAEPTTDDVVEALLSTVYECTCESPLRVERAEWRGASRTYCARCDLPVPIRWPVR